MSIKVLFFASLRRVVAFSRKLILVFVRFFCKNKILNTEFNPEILSEAWQNHQPHLLSSVPLNAGDNTIDVSLIIPLYNSTPFIDKLLDSLINQKTNYKYEVILIDDGSTDNTLELFKNKTQNSPCLINIIHQENQGISAARNTGLTNSKGKYVSFIDHDDIISSDYVQMLISKAYEHNADIVKCAYSIFSYNKKISTSQTEDAVIIGPMNDELFKYRSYIWGGIYKRELFKYIRFPLDYWYEDMIVRCLLYRQSKCFVNISKSLYNHIQHNSNASKILWSNKNNKAIEQLYLSQHMVLASEKLSLPNDVYLYKTLLKEFSNMMLIRIREIKPDVKKQVFLSASEFLKKYWKQEYVNYLTHNEKKWNDAIINKKYYYYIFH